MKDHDRQAPFFAGAEARRIAWLGGLAIMLVALALNLRVLRFGFLLLMDDDINVVFNPHLGQLDWDSLRWALTDCSYVRRYIPAGWLSFLGVYGQCGFDPAGYHAAALGFFFLNTGLIHCVLLHGLRAFVPRARREGLGAWDAGAALLATAWWALHPLRVESTAWASGLLYGQATALFLAALIGHLRGLLALESGRSRAPCRAAALAGLTLSLATYPVALGAPFLLAALEWLHARGAGLPGREAFRRAAREAAVLAIPVLAALALTLDARASNAQAWGPLAGWVNFPLVNRLAQASYISVYYLWRPWWPFGLAPYYDTLVGFNPYSAVFVGSAAAVVLATLGAVLSYRKRPWVPALWLGYLAMAAPFFGITEAPHFSSDRYACLTTVIMAGILAVGLASARARTTRLVLCAVFLSGAAGLARLSWQQEGNWRDGTTLFDSLIARFPHSGVAERFVAKKAIVDFFEGRATSARETLAAHLKIHPDDPELLKAARIVGPRLPGVDDAVLVPFAAVLHETMAMELVRTSRRADAEAHLSAALAISDRYTEAVYNRAVIRLRAGRLDEALHDYFWAEIQTTLPVPPADRKRFLVWLSQAETAAGRPNLARAALERTRR